ncbi:MAG: hypothetical protein J7J38_00895 [Candidatus Aenigmarchaeota archaeon]|nr:hypothetical protein [Candidatus Aenigmarchaeota archaeon]
MKRKRKNIGKSIRTCPICNSTDVMPYVGFNCGMLWQCRSCGYVGALIIEKSVMKKLPRNFRQRRF